MDELFHQPGFFGTKGNWAADITLLLSLLVALTLTVGVVMALKGKYEVHRWFQTSAASLNAILVGWMMILPFRDFIAAPDNPGGLPITAINVTRLHAAVGASALIFGIFVVLRANGLMIKPLRFNNYKLFMRISFVLYMAASLIGIFVYITWFITNPNPAPTY